MGYAGWLAAVTAVFARRRGGEPIGNRQILASFVATRAAFIAQKTLYGYLRTRIGTRYPKVFQDAPFVESINIAKMHVYAACVSDLAIFTAARATGGTDVSTSLCREIALQSFDHALAENAGQAHSSFNADETRAAFMLRLDATDWAGRAHTRENFDHSPAALVRWAPIAPQLKQFDAEIVENSMTFAWSEVRREFERRVDADAIAADEAAAGNAATLRV